LEWGDLILCCPLPSSPKQFLRGLVGEWSAMMGGQQRPAAIVARAFGTSGGLDEDLSTENNVGHKAENFTGH